MTPADTVDSAFELAEHRWEIRSVTAHEFQERLVSLLHQRPFVPFEVELTCGDKFIVDQSDAVSWGGGAAVCGGADGEIYLIDYTRTRGFTKMSEAAAK